MLRGRGFLGLLCAVCAATLIFTMAVGAVTGSAAGSGIVHATWTPNRQLPLSLTDVSCGSARLCVGSGSRPGSGSAYLALSTDPFRPSSWRLDTHRGADLAGIVFDCPSAHLCLTDGFTRTGEPDLYASAAPSHGIRTFKQVVPGVYLPSGGIGSGAAVSCATPRFCALIVSDNSGTHAVRISGDPSRPGSWRKAPLPPAGKYGSPQTDIMCASRQLCLAYATGSMWQNVAVLDNPTLPGSRWARSTVDSEANSYSVVSGSCNSNGCLPEELTGGACAAPASCLFTTGYGAIISSTQADGGASTWTRTRIYGTRNANRDVYELMNPVCFSTSLCYVLGVKGDLLVSTAPFSGSASAWQDIHIPGVGSPQALSCPNPGLCFVFTYGRKAPAPTGLSIAHLTIN